MSNEFIKRTISSFILIPLSLFVVIKGSIYFNFFLSACLILSIIEWCKMTKYNLVSIFGSILILFSFYAVYRIRNDFNEDPKYLLLILTICISTDIGGFIFGKLFKGPKLSKISPNKTFSGVIGSYLFALSAAFSFIYFFKLKNLDMSIYLLTFLIFFISTISQIGDLTMSYFKRLAKIKDTGKVIPGHGGILDRIDGMIFVFFFLYIFLLIQKILL